MNSSIPILLTNTFSKKKEPLTPIHAGKVGMYVCGITPYEHSHLGHARSYTNFDILFRLLRHSYAAENVTYVRNFTDIDDNIIEHAAKRAEQPLAMTERFIASYHADMAALGNLPPTVEPRVSQTLPEICALIELLLAKEIAYKTASGDVNYDISKFSAYGKLSHKKLDDLLAGARVAVSDEKHNPGDFALWKAAKPGEPAWDSPFGKGRPGWHIECSAMSKKYLGAQFDIHCGGEDLQFPHHENEIAQSEGAHGHTYANLWLHNAFITVGNRKMSKSLGNFTLIGDALKLYSGAAIRLWVMQTHYRKPLDYSPEALAATQSRWDKVGKKLDGITPAPALPDDFLQALADDLNTSKALASFNGALGANDLPSARAMGEFLGLCR